ncbi:MAG TPA: hypothetical protein VM925_24675 [Labilithrix sp.]|jgi:hypothetical protein|nr:hypothetical protein [Labilithrix sp.]
MQQRTRRLAIVFGGALLTTIGVLAACSTDNGTTPVPGQNGTDSGSNNTKTDSGKVDTDTDGAASPSDAGADCSEAPRLRSNTSGFFCGFFRRDASAPDSGSGSLSACSNDETCCNPGKGGGADFPPSFCAKTPHDEKGGDNGQTECADQADENGSTWNVSGSTTWECGDKNNCDDGQVCCLVTWADAGATDKVNIGKSLDKEIPASCGALQAFKQGGTKCAASCAADQIQLCSTTDDNCTGNQKCTPFTALFRDLAYCK